VKAQFKLVVYFFEIIKILILLLPLMYIVAGASGSFPAAAFEGTVSVLIIVIVLLAVVIVVMIGAICIKKVCNVILCAYDQPYKSF
jgi:hypothetical protein